MKILVTGGAGYIGSHTCVALLEAGEDIVVVDNLSNSSVAVIERIKKITSKDFVFYKMDVRDEENLNGIFKANEIGAVIHFAGLKAVGESVTFPLKYYENNLCSTLQLLKVMEKFQVKNFVFSSSATVYGDPHKVPITEDFPLSTTNPYGATKLMIENMLKDIHIGDHSWNIAILRYFNPVGAHQSGTIGENPNGIPNNLVPYITQVAIGKLACLSVFGNDYPTLDGTGVRDYIHVTDLAEGHLAALKKLETNCGLVIYNLGTGKGYSVLEMVDAFQEACGKKIPFEIQPRRAGDVAKCYSNPAKAESELNWKAKKGLKEMCEDSWRWQKNNPGGYEDHGL